MAFAQYIIYLIVGLFLTFVMGTYFSVAAGFTFLTVIFVFLPLFLAGYFSGISFFYPRISAVASIIAVLPFLVSAIYNFINKIPFSEPVVFAIPSIIVLFVSILVFFQNKPSFWSVRKTKLSRFFTLILAGIPAILTTSVLISFLIKIRR